VWRIKADNQQPQIPPSTRTIKEKEKGEGAYGSSSSEGAYGSSSSSIIKMRHSMLGRDSMMGPSTQLKARTSPQTKSH